MNSQIKKTTASDQNARQLLRRFEIVRRDSLALVNGLSDADTTVQSMPDASPAKWHLAHTTWFFEAVILSKHLPGYEAFDPAFAYLFNSYYEALGPRHARPRRGLLTRPTLDRVRSYRDHVDRGMAKLLSDGTISTELLQSIALGVNHEQQHQELLLTDLLHLFSQNPLNPEYRAPVPLSMASGLPNDSQWISFDGGLYQTGHEGDDFSFDCEGPRHEVVVPPFELATKPVTIGEWITFMEDGGYTNPMHWLSDGWATVQQENWQAPLYWEKHDDHWWAMTLRGFQPVNLAAPISHISYFEADAYARWAGHRLPTEFEWEMAAETVPVQGHFADRGLFRPLPATNTRQGLSQMFGDVWEWTSSPYMAYPGFKPAGGIAAEYNGKFMSGQIVLRGGSCVTPANHIRATYRNFFYPHQRWQFSGLRLAASL